MSSSASSPSHLCVVCGLGARSFCKACKGAPNTDLTTTTTVWYCGPECQKKDWNKHKPLCEEAQARKEAAPVMPKPVQHYCARCGHEANLKCKACLGAPESTDLTGKVSVWYCRKGCQKKDWANHKSICKQAQARVEICRIAGLLQDLFYIFGRVSNMWALGRIEKIGGLWFLHPPSEYMGTSQLIAFPPPCVTTVEEEKVVLSYNSCSCALSSLHNLIALLLKGYCCDIAEVEHKVKNQQFRLLRVFENGEIDGTDYSHLVLKITISNGEQYAIDITGAQYGWIEAILPWNLYSASRIRSAEKVMAFGQTVVDLRKRCQEIGGQREWVYEISEEFGKALDVLIAQIEADGILPTMSALVKLPEIEFMAQRKDLLDTIHHSLEQAKTLAEEQGSFRTVPGLGGGYDRELKPMV